MSKKTIILIVIMIMNFLSCSVEDVGNGNLLVRWKIGGKSCYKANVANVKIRLFEGNDLIQESLEQCMVQEYLISDIPAGSYKIEVQGLSSKDNKFTYEGSTEHIIINPNTTLIMENAIVLSERKASIEINWKFSNGKPCSFNGIELLEITIWDEHSNRDFFEYTQCNPSIKQDQTETTGYLIQKLDAEQLNIELFGLDVEENRLFTGGAVITTEHGEKKPVEIELYKCDDMDFFCY